MEDLVTEGFWNKRRVFLTGHTGFKGSWLALWLSQLGANVRGYSLHPCTQPNLFTELRLAARVDDVRGNILDGVELEAAMQEFRPEVVFHLAAQPLVRYSYVNPIETYETNVIGTARVLDAVRRIPSIRAIVLVTTDKCYDNREWEWPYRETDALGGHDPYSSSKACTEIVSAAYRQSYFPLHRFSEHRVGIATARAGNVIGGGDWSEDRLIPDMVRSFMKHEPVKIRRPHAIRPWQHVLEPLHGYMLLAEALSGEAARFSTAYNFGPSSADAQPVSWIVEKMTNQWGDGASWILDHHEGPHEAGYLRLDASRANRDLGWVPALNLETALEWLVDWYKSWKADRECSEEKTINQIGKYTTRLMT